MIDNRLQNDVSLNTKLMVLFIALVQILSVWFYSTEFQYAFIILISLTAVLLVDYYFLFKGRYKNMWSYMKWILFGIMIMLTLVAFF